ncbi:MAG: glycogen synthase GlgA [Mariniblastus sp.]|nr:glycogen synthase GlgA [Mariniblastus sp.]
MKILLASSEVVPFAKTGGLADVAGALPRALEKLGHEVTVFMPAYESISKSEFNVEPTGIELRIPIGHEIQSGQLLRSQLPDSNISVYLIEHAHYFGRSGLYGENGNDYLDNCERFTFFSRGVLESLRSLGSSPDLIHVNDWQTGLIPALIKCELSEHPLFREMASVITVHNLAYQGLFDYEKMAVTGLDPKYFNWQQMEFYQKLNLLKTGLVFSDAISTVSPTYAKEIQGAEQGCGLEGVLKNRAHRLTGILNGIDGDEWNPNTDQFLPVNFNSQFDLRSGNAGKAKCKHELQIESKLEPNPNVPLIGIVGRLASQKGWSLILPVLRQWLESVEAQWVILGTGDPDYHHVLSTLHRSYPTKLALTLGFSNEYAHRIEAGSDMFVMPSQYEPCGLNQMYSMAYGTIPIVRHTGGLADTVINVSPETLENKTATGFSFEDFSVGALDNAITRAVRMYYENRPTWNQLIQTGMNRDWSWNASAKRYEELYRKAILHHSLG